MPGWPTVLLALLYAVFRLLLDASAANPASVISAEGRRGGIGACSQPGLSSSGSGLDSAAHLSAPSLAELWGTCTTSDR